MEKTKSTRTTREGMEKEERQRTRYIRPVKRTPVSDSLKKRMLDKVSAMQRKRKRSPIKDDHQIKNAKTASQREAQFRAMVQNIHRKRLDNLLHSNELRRISVPVDGDCFFQSVVRSMGLDLDHRVLRTDICNHMLANTDAYLPFVKSDGDCTQQSRAEAFAADVETLKQPGRWNMTVADCFPAALSNIYDRQVRIFSSQVTNSVINFEPTIGEQTRSELIYLAHTSNRGLEHYDAVGPLLCQEKDHNQCEIVHETEDQEKDRVPSVKTMPTPVLSAPPQNDESKGDTPLVQVTPHKRAEYRSPGKKISSRKKKINPKTWRRNIRKAQRNTGQQYTSVHGKTVEARSVKARNCSKCRFKCSDKITEEERQSIFQNYWTLGNFERQRQFICQHIETTEPKRKQENSKRNTSNQYFLTVENAKVRVCRCFFEATLDIGKKTIYSALTKRTHGVYSGRDGRGKHTPSNKVDLRHIQLVKRHIESFPRMESHYSRHESRKEYLAHDLNIKKMYQLYADKCRNDNEEPVKESKYRQIFCENYNLSFYHPKKDQCTTCSLHESRKAGGVIDATSQTQYDEHRQRKEEAREEKIKDKTMAKDKDNYHVETFDLQAVLTTPCSLVGELYYKRKLCVYNLSFYSLRNGSATCYVWDETQANRGACEIATCISKQIASICTNPRIDEITFYSDTCAGQNRNQFVATALLRCLSKYNQLKVINHQFF